MALERLNQRELVQKTTDFNNATTEYTRSTTQRILEETAQAAKEPISVEAWNEYIEKVVRNVAEQANIKTSEDPIYNAILDELASKSNKTYKNVNDMIDTISCQQVIPRLKEITLEDFSVESIPIFKEIRHLNRDLKWNLELGLETVEQISMSQALDGLNGRICTDVPSLAGLGFLESICNTTHPDLRFQLEMATHEVPIRELQKYTAILSRMEKLSLFWGELATEEDSDVPALEALCSIYEFELALEGSDLQFLRSCTYLPDRLVSAKLVLSDEEEMPQLKYYGKRGVLRELNLTIGELRSIVSHKSYKCPMTYLSFDSPPGSSRHHDTQ